MLAHPLANGAVGPLDEIVQFALPIVLLVLLWWWAKRGERRKERASTVTADGLVIDFRAEPQPAGRDRYVVVARDATGASRVGAVLLRIGDADELVLEPLGDDEYAVEAPAPRGGGERSVVVRIRREGGADTIATFALAPISA